MSSNVKTKWEDELKVVGEMHWDGNLRLACMLQYKLIPSNIILLYYISLYIIIVWDTCETVPEQLTIRPENAGLLRAIIFELILCLQDRMIPCSGINFSDMCSLSFWQNSNNRNAMQ